MSISALLSYFRTKFMQLKSSYFFDTISLHNFQLVSLPVTELFMKVITSLTTLAYTIYQFFKYVTSHTFTDMLQQETTLIS